MPFFHDQFPVLGSSIIIIVSFSILLYVLIKGRTTPLLYSFSALVFLFLLWGIGWFGNYYAPNSLFFEMLGYPVWSLSVPIWLIFVVYFTGFRRFQSRWLLLAFAIPVLEYISFLVNDIAGITLSFRKFFLLLNSIESYLIIFVCIVCFVVFLRKQPLSRKLQYIFLSLLTSASFIAEISANLFFMFVCTLLIYFTIAIFKFRLNNLLPVALTHTLESMEEAVMLVDRYNFICNCNHPFKQLFPEITGQKSESIQLFSQKLVLSHSTPSKASMQLIEALDDPLKVDVIDTISLDTPLKRHFQVSIQPVLGKQNFLLGRLITLSDITEYQEMTKELNQKTSVILEKNDELMSMNEELTKIRQKLMKFTQNAEELAVTAERNQFAKEVHDKIGHTLISLITTLEVCQSEGNTSSDDLSTRIEDCIGIAQNGLGDVKASVWKIIYGKLEVESQKAYMEKLSQEFSKSEMSVEFIMDDENYLIHKVYWDLLYRVSKEALENSIIHGKARASNIMVKLREGKVKVFIIDQGIGCKTIVKRKGLLEIQKNVENFSGIVVFGSDGESGFNIRIELPLTFV